MRALILGGGNTLRSDLKKVEELGIEYDAVFACNDAGFEWPGELEGWVTLHPEKLAGWTKKRQERGYPPAKALWAHRQDKRPDAERVKVTPYMFPGQTASGSSGLFVCKVALIDCGFESALLCGIPLTPTPHFFDDKAWRSCKGFRRAWPTVKLEYRERMRSMSGWTRVLLGGPDDYSLCDGSEDESDEGGDP